jgi:glycosyltransferase involved in cell wall biosynthesis
MKRNVAILHYTAPPIVGGVESTIYHHARLLTEAGYSVKVIAGRGGEIFPGVILHTIPAIDSRNPRILEVGKLLARGEVTHEFSELTELLLNELRDNLQPDEVCIVHNAMTLHKNLPLTAALYKLATENNQPMIAWSHDFAWQDRLYLPDLHPGYPWNLLRIAWEGVRYVVVSKHRRSKLAQLFDIPEHEIQVVNPGVEAPAFLKLALITQELTNKLHLFEADPLVLLPARITRRKNIEFAIQITAALINHKPQATLVITGPPGPHNPTNITYLQTLNQLKSELGVVDRVHFLYEQGVSGNALHLADEVVADLYRLADLLLFPSKREGFGIPILEAGLARLPIFAADIPPLRESTGSLAHLFDPNSDAEEVAGMIASYLREDSAYQLRQRVLRNYSWRSIVDKELIPLIEATTKSVHQRAQAPNLLGARRNEKI